MNLSNSQQQYRYPHIENWSLSDRTNIEMLWNIPHTPPLYSHLHQIHLLFLCCQPSLYHYHHKTSRHIFHHYNSLIFHNHSFAYCFQLSDSLWLLNYLLFHNLSCQPCNNNHWLYLQLRNLFPLQTNNFLQDKSFHYNWMYFVLSDNQSHLLWLQLNNLLLPTTYYTKINDMANHKPMLQLSNYHVFHNFDSHLIQRQN